MPHPVYYTRIHELQWNRATPTTTLISIMMLAKACANAINVLALMAYQMRSAPLY